MAKIKLEFEAFLFRYLIKQYLTPKNPKYAYDTEKGGYNPAFQNISDDHFHCPLQIDEKRIFALRSDFILATGTKNYGECSFHKPFSMFSDDSHQYLDSKDRYGHPSLAVPHDEYNGSAYYAGWLAQRKGYMQIYLYSGRFHRKFTLDERTLVETYLTKQFINAYGEQPIRFYDPEDFDDSDEFMKFLKNGHLETLFREYDLKSYNNLLESLPKKERHYKAFLSTQPDGTKLSKTLTKLPHSLIKTAGAVYPLGKTIGAGIFEKTKLSDKNLANKIEKTIDETQEHTDKNKTYTQLLASYNLKLCSRKPANSKILPHFFYLYLEADEIKYTYQDESNNILDKKLKATDISKDDYEHLKQKLKSPSMQFFSLNTTNKDFPYTLWDFEPEYTQIPKHSVSLYINYEGKLCAAFRCKDKQTKILIFAANTFELKPKDYEYAICKDRPNTCKKEKTFYLYLNDGGLRCLYRDKDQKEQRWVIEEKSNFYKLVQQVLDKENHKPKIISYYNETVQISLNKASGLVLNELDNNNRIDLAIDLCLEACTDNVEEESASFGEELEILNSQEEAIPKNHPLPTKQLSDKNEPHETEVQALNAQIKALQNTILLQKKQLQEEKERREADVKALNLQVNTLQNTIQLQAAQHQTEKENHNKETKKLKVHNENLQNGQSEYRKEFKKLQNLNHILLEDRAKLEAKSKEDGSKISLLEQQAQELITNNNTLNQRVNTLLDTNHTDTHTYSKRYHFYEDKPVEPEECNELKDDDLKRTLPP